MHWLTVPAFCKARIVTLISLTALGHTTTDAELKIELDRMIKNLPGRASQAFRAELR